MVMQVARKEEYRNTLKTLTGKPAVKRPLGRPWRKLEDNNSIDLKEIDVNANHWID